MNNQPQQDLVDVLAEEFLARRLRGESCSVEEYMERYPDRTEDIREVFSALLFLEDAKQSVAPDARADATFPEFDDYQIVREIGRGGMGIVYEAEQLSLSRRVALKILPDNASLDKRARERFQLEARSAAGLHHSNIVPVFEVGISDQRCFYAMQFIQGENLAVVYRQIKNAVKTGSLSGSEDNILTSTFFGKTERNSSTCRKIDGRASQTNARTDTALEPGILNPSRKREMGLADTLPNLGKSVTLVSESRTKPFFKMVARIGQQVAEALQYAHEQKIIHRDIKPANLMLDVSGIVWVTDFGLAKSDENDLTRTGDIVGTLRYMSPERFSGVCDAQSDIYSLGMTLYELLALRPAFESSDRLALIEQIKNRQPESLRSIDSKIPADLQTIIDKSMEKESRRRYLSAGEMAEDLERFLDGQPIRARRVGAAERLILWARKRRALAASLAAVTLLLLIGLIGSLIAAFHFRDLADQNLSLVSEKENQMVIAESQRDEAYLNSYYADIRLAQQDWENGQIRRMLETLRRFVPGDNENDIRGLEWYYLLALAHQDEHTISGHENEVTQVKWTRDGARLISSSTDGTLRIWSHAGEPVNQISIPGLRDFSLSPEGSQMVTASGDSVLRIWEIGTGTMIRAIRTEMVSIDSLDWSPHGNRIVIASRETTHPHLIDSTSGKSVSEVLCEPSFSYKDEKPRNVKFSPDGKYLAVLIRGHSQIWDVESEKVINYVSVPESQIHCFDWHPDSVRFVAGAYLSGGYLFEVSPSQAFAKMLGRFDERASVESVSFSADGTEIVSGNRAQLVQVLKTDNLETVDTFKGHVGWINSTHWQPGGSRIASGSVDGTIKIWSVGQDLEMESKVLKWELPMSQTSADKRFSWIWKPDHSIRIANAATGKVIVSSSTVRPPQFVPGQDWVILDEEGGEIRFWNTTTGKVDFRASNCFSSVDSVGNPTRSRRGKFVAATTDGSYLKIVNLETGFVRNIRAHEKGFCLELSPDGSHLTTASYGEVKLWDCESGKEIANFYGHAPGYWISRIKWDFNGRFFATGGWDQTIKLWDAPNKQLWKTLHGHQSAISDMYFSSDGTRLVSIADKVKLWDVATGRELLSISNPNYAEFERLKKDVSVESCIENAEVWFRDLDQQLSIGANTQGVRDFEHRKLHDLARRILFAVEPESGDVERSLLLAKNAISLHPTSADYLFTLAYAQFRNGLFKQAKANANNAVQTEPQHFEARALMSICELESGNLKDAEKWMSKLIDDTARSETLSRETTKLIRIYHKRVRQVSTADGDSAPHSQVITVTTLKDEIDGAKRGGVSLRDAIVESGPGTTIEFGVTGTILLKYGSLDIDRSITIKGPGSDRLAIDGLGNSSIFLIDDGNADSQVSVTLSGLRLTNGVAARDGSFNDQFNRGGAIYACEDVTASDLVFDHNRAKRGAAVYVSPGANMKLLRCSVIDNSAEFSGAIKVGMNRATKPASLVVDSCTFARNSAGFFGGAIHNSSQLEITNSTFVANRAGNGTDRKYSTNGGAIFTSGFYLAQVFVRIESCTIVNNIGGGIGVQLPDAKEKGNRLRVRNSIVYGNSHLQKSVDIESRFQTSQQPEEGTRNPVVSVADSLVGAGSYIDIGNVVSGVDPQLGILGDHGGRTQTIPLLPGSPAIDAGGLSDRRFDQRGSSFPRVVDGDGTAGGQTDFGAFELQ